MSFIAPMYFYDRIIFPNGIPNGPGSILTLNNNTISTRTNAEIISDMGLMTTNTGQSVLVRKDFYSFSGSNWTNNTLMIYSTNANPAITFYKEGINVGQLGFDGGGFHFWNGDATSYYLIKSNGFIKAGSDDNYLLLGGGSHKPLSDLIQVDSTLGINNGSDTRTNKTWFDYNWAGTGYAGSVINFSGVWGGYNIELYASYAGGGTVLGFRSRNGDAGSWNLHNWIWHSGNFNPDSKVNRSGDTMTGNLNMGSSIITTDTSNSNDWGNAYNNGLVNRGRVFQSNVDANNLGNQQSAIISIELGNGSGNTNFPVNNTYGTFIKMSATSFTSEFFHQNGGDLYHRNWYFGDDPNGYPFRKIWDSINFNPTQYVTTSSLNSTLAGYATLAGVQTFQNTITFSQSPIIPNGTLGTHAVNLNQLNTKANVDGSNATDTWRNASHLLSLNPDSSSGKMFNASGTSDLVNATNGNVGGFINNYGTATGNPGENWFHRIKMLHGNASGYYTEIAVQMTSGNSMWYKRYENGSDYGWVQVWDKENLSQANINNWNIAYGWGNHANAGYATGTWVNTNFIPKTHPVYNITQANINSWVTYGYLDNVLTDYAHKAESNVFTKANTFEVSPTVPTGSNGSDAVNVDQLFEVASNQAVETVNSKFITEIMNTTFASYDLSGMSYPLILTVIAKSDGELRVADVPKGGSVKVRNVSSGNVEVMINGGNSTIVSANTWTDYHVDGSGDITATSQAGCWII